MNSSLTRDSPLDWFPAHDPAPHDRVRSSSLGVEVNRRFANGHIYGQTRIRSLANKPRICTVWWVDDNTRVLDDTNIRNGLSVNLRPSHCNNVGRAHVCVNVPSCLDHEGNCDCSSAFVIQVQGDSSLRETIEQYFIECEESHGRSENDLTIDGPVYDEPGFTFEIIFHNSSPSVVPTAPCCGHECHADKQPAIQASYCNACGWLIWDRLAG